MPLSSSWRELPPSKTPPRCRGSAWPTASATRRPRPVRLLPARLYARLSAACFHRQRAARTGGMHSDTESPVVAAGSGTAGQHEGARRAFQSSWRGSADGARRPQAVRGRRPASLPGIRPLGGTPPSRAPCDRSTCGRGACCAGAKEATGGAHRRRAAALYRHDDMSCCSDGGPGRCKARHAACRRPDASDLQRRVNTAVPCFACAWGRSAGCRWRGLATRGCAFDGRLAYRNAKGCFYLARLYDGVVWHSACPVWAAQLSRLPEAVRDACALRRLSARRRARACSFPKSSAA